MEVSSSRFITTWPESLLNVDLFEHLSEAGRLSIDSEALLRISSVLEMLHDGQDEAACLPCEAQTGFSLSRALKRLDESAEMEVACCMNPALIYIREPLASPSPASSESQQSPLDSESTERLPIINETTSTEIQPDVHTSKQTVKLRNEDNENQEPNRPVGNVQASSKVDVQLANKHAPITAYFWKYNAMSNKSKRRPPDWESSSLLPSSESGLSIYQLEESLHADDDEESDKPNPESLYDLGVRFRHFSQLAKAADALRSRPLPNDASGVIGAQVGTFTTAPTGRKRKGMYSSRIWRLKKKMRREANKLKLHALNQEHGQLIRCVAAARNLLRTSLNELTKFKPGNRTMVDIFDELVNSRLGAKVSGRTDAFVFDLMQDVERKRRLAGEGGLLELS